MYVHMSTFTSINDSFHSFYPRTHYETSYPYNSATALHSSDFSSTHQFVIFLENIHHYKNHFERGETISSLLFSSKQDTVITSNSSFFIVETEYDATRTTFVTISDMFHMVTEQNSVSYQGRLTESELLHLSASRRYKQCCLHDFSRDPMLLSYDQTAG